MQKFWRFAENRCIICRMVAKVGGKMMQAQRVTKVFVVYYVAHVAMATMRFFIAGNSAESSAAVSALMTFLDAPFDLPNYIAYIFLVLVKWDDTALFLGIVLVFSVLLALLYRFKNAANITSWPKTKLIQWYRITRLLTWFLFMALACAGIMYTASFDPYSPPYSPPYIFLRYEILSLMIFILYLAVPAMAFVGLFKTRAVVESSDAEIENHRQYFKLIVIVFLMFSGWWFVDLVWGIWLFGYVVG